MKSISISVIQLSKDLGLQIGAKPPYKLEDGVSSFLSTPLQGERNNRIFRIACRLRAKNLHYEEAKSVVLQAASQCIPPLPAAEALSCLDSAWKYGEKPERMTDLGNAKRLRNLFGYYIRYVPEFGNWICWTGACWRIDADGEIQRAVKETTQLIQAEANTAKASGDGELEKVLFKHAMKSQSAGALSAMEKVARTEPGISISSSRLDADPMLLGVENGVVDLKTGVLFAAKPEQYITKLVNATYDPNAQCQIFLAFLEQIMGGNIKLVELIQRALGYSLTGQTCEQCLFILYGSGANGKSTLLSVIRELFGDYGIQSPASTLMTKSGNGVPNDIARLRGARFVATSEVEESQRFAEAMVKQLTGEDTITARFLFHEFFEFVPAFKVFLAANHKPTIKGDDYAIWRRIKLIPFNITIPPEKQDKELPKKLREEFPGILNWIIKGCLAWQAQGLNLPADVIDATKEYQVEMDVFGQWLDECCSMGPSRMVKASKLLGSQQLWAEENGTPPLNSTQLGIKLKKRGFQKIKKESGYHYIGIDLVNLQGLNSLHSFTGTLQK